MARFFKNKFLGLSLLLMATSACHDKAALKQALIEKTVQEKITSFERKKRATCQREALEEVLEIADSIMIQLALSKVDTTGKGNRPIKPIRPILDLPVDTTPIKPLFEKAITPLEDTVNLTKKPELIKEDTLEKDVKKGK